MHIDVVLSNAEVSFIRKFLKIQIILLEARRRASKPFLSEAPTPNVSLWWKSREKQRKISGRVAIQCVIIPPVLLLKTELQSRKPEP